MSALMNRPLQRENVAPRSVHHNQLDVGFSVQITVAGDEHIVTGIEVFTHGIARVVVLVIEPLVSIAQTDVSHRFRMLH